jgi:hyaluronan synthase
VNHEHSIPDVRLRSGGRLAVAFVALSALLAWTLYRVFSMNSALHGRDRNALLWTALFLAAGHQVFLAWRDKPFTVSERQARGIALLNVGVSVPLFNESPEIVDRVMYALYRQTRLPQIIYVVDDGSTRHLSEYGEIRDFWQPRFAARNVFFLWERQENKGKRHAQAVAFANSEIDVFLTLDSDTALERRAIEEILKPFADPRVMSVAGVEVAYNANKNLLTRICSLRQIAWQLVGCSALNRFGQILVNRGTFAAYRAEVVQDNLTAYLGEMFMGKPVKYSDDSLLTMYALQKGRAVQQLTAFQLPEYPEYVSHQLRQWIRWMRGSTIRSLWRARYLPMTSYGWWMNILSWWQFLTASLAYLYVWAYLPAEGRFGLASVAVAIACTYLMPLRNLLIDRSDETSLQQIDTYLLAPVSWAWSLFVLRPLRLYGALTCANNGWGTRSIVEVGQQARKADGMRDTLILPVFSEDTVPLPKVTA